MKTASVPTERELRARRKIAQKLSRLHSKQEKKKKKFPSTEEMVRQDRAR